jgi:hypothetical protein
MAKLSDNNIENIRKYLVTAGNDTLSDLLDTIDCLKQEIKLLTQQRDSQQRIAIKLMAENEAMLHDIKNLTSENIGLYLKGW